MRETACLAGARWPVCHRCAGVGATLAQEGCLEPVRHCLHLFAMEVEALAEGYQSEVGPMRRWLSRVRARLAEGLPRRECPCDGCNGRPVPGAIEDLHAFFGVEFDDTAEGADWRTLKSMREAERLKASDGSTWRAVDEIARRVVQFRAETYWAGPKEGGLAARARPLMPRLRDNWWAEDAEARRYWAGWARFGPGYLDGPYYVDEWGECHEWGPQ